MYRYLPILLGVVAIVGLTIPQIRMTDRLSGSNVTADERAKLLAHVPMVVGNWHGEDLAVDETVRETAGAIGTPVSRVYRNVRTGEVVDLWLIVGHGRDIASHTPNICYRASGFEMRAPESSLYPMVFPGQPEAPFLTNTFFKEDLTGRRIVRVFWSWYNPESDTDQSTVEWEAPSNARWHFGNTRALYKMYFTSEMREPAESADESPCLRFAREFLPEVNKALALLNDPNAKAEPLTEVDAAETESTESKVSTDEKESTPTQEAASDAKDAVPAAEQPAAKQ